MLLVKREIDNIPPTYESKVQLPDVYTTIPTLTDVASAEVDGRLNLGISFNWGPPCQDCLQGNLNLP